MAAAGVTVDAYAQQVEAYSMQVMSSSSSPFADLVVTSTPSKARVTIKPKYGSTAREETTDAPFPNLTIGRYRSSVALSGFASYEGELDWLNNTQPKFSCTLAPIGGGTSSCQRGQ